MKLKDLINDTYYLLLSFFARSFERLCFSNVNRVFRIFYLWILIPFLKMLFWILLDFKHTLIPRHSILKADEFNVFFSDIDLTLVSEGKISLTQADFVHTIRAWIRFLLPMFGEIEIFTSDEYEMLILLNRNNFKLINYIKDLKKMFWIVSSVGSLKSEYHILKHRRAFKKCVRNLAGKAEFQINENEFLSVDIVKGLEQKLIEILNFSEAEQREVTSILEKINIHTFYSREYHFTFNLSGHSPFQIHKNFVLLLHSISPRHFDDPYFLETVRFGLAAKYAIRHSLDCNLIQAYIYSLASPRVHISYRNEVWEWQNNLKEQIEKHGTNLRYQQVMEL